jgi:galactan 5-O-arabinofuranosyltransferase
VLPVAALLGWLAVVAVVSALDPSVVDPSTRTAVTVLVPVVGAVVGVAVALLARRRTLLAADALVVSTAALLAGLSSLALHGTRWGWYALYADASFRTQMATRYADTARLVDYGYRDLPSYYPPAVGWLEGRAAALLEVPGWEMLRPAEVLLAGLIPLLSYPLWCRLLPRLPAAAVTVATTVLAADVRKPDEWLVVCCLVPWWLDAVRDLRAEGVPPRADSVHGLIAGALLLVHTFYFLPLGVATLLGIGWDAATRHPQRLPLRRAVVIGVVALAVSSPSWSGTVLARLQGRSADVLQLRYAVPHGNVPPFPSSFAVADLVGAIGLVGLLLAAWRWRRRGEADPLLGGLALALVGAWCTEAVGALAASRDVGLLTFKVAELVVLLQVAAGVLTAARLLAWLRRDPRRTTASVAAVAAGLTLAGAFGAFNHRWVLGRPAQVALTTPYPDGTVPAGARGQQPAYGVFGVRSGGPSTDAVLAAWDAVSAGATGSDAVLVTSRVDLLATSPVHGFIAWKSIYSNPLGQWEDRLALLRRVARCPSSRCAAVLLRDNPYDAVDGLVLDRRGTDLVLRLTVDDFPDRTRPVRVTFPATLFRSPLFERRDVGAVTVVALRGTGTD